MARKPGHRSERTTLERLARRHLFFELDPQQVQPFVDLVELGLQCGAALSTRDGAARESVLDHIGAEALRRAGLTRLHGFSAHAREAWRRLLPLLTVLDTGNWSERDYAMLLPLTRAKAGRSERAFVKTFRAHTALSDSLRAWATAQVTHRRAG